MIPPTLVSSPTVATRPDAPAQPVGPGAQGVAPSAAVNAPPLAQFQALLAEAQKIYGDARVIEARLTALLAESLTPPAAPLTKAQAGVVSGHLSDLRRVLAELGARAATLQSRLNALSVAATGEASPVPAYAALDSVLERLLKTLPVPSQKGLMHLSPDEAEPLFTALAALTASAARQLDQASAAPVSTAWPHLRPEVDALSASRLAAAQAGAQRLAELRQMPRHKARSRGAETAATGPNFLFENFLRFFAPRG